MSTFKYADKFIRTRDIMIIVPSMLIAFGILRFTRELASVTETIDGWISIVISSFVAICLVWLVTKLASQFPNQTFMEYASTLVSKPVAVILTFLFAVLGTLLTSYEVRAIGVVSEQYLFRETPMEVVTLSFLWVVVYAVCGARAGIFRLNALFLPIIIISVIIIVLFSTGFMELRNVLPVFTTDLQGYMKGVGQSPITFTGIGILFFYIAYVRQPKKAPAMAVVGMGFVVLLYILIYLTCIAVFGSATEVIRLPLIELAKSIEIPGGFFERIDSVFYVIWIMAIFTTTAITFDIAILALTLIFPKVNKRKMAIGLAPFIFIISTFPRDYVDVGSFGEILSYFELGLTVVVLTLLWTMYLIKGRRKHGK